MKDNSEISQLKGVGDKTAPLLHKLGIYTIRDLLEYFPRDYERYNDILSVKDVYSRLGDDQQVTLKLEIKNIPQLRFVKKYQFVNVLAGDNTGVIELQWINQRYIKNAIKFGQTYIFRGRILNKGSRVYLSNPKILKEQELNLLQSSLQPIYPLTKGIKKSMLQKLVHQAIEETEKLEDYLPALLNEINLHLDEDLMEINEAIKGIHFPVNLDLVKRARKRLVFDEFLFFLLKVRKLKADKGRCKNEVVLKNVSQTATFLDNLPYKLTAAQLRTWEEIKKDLQGEFSMNRLVQGDVGSGKTVIAFLALIQCVFNGYQGMLMAPTEVLARQHYEEIKRLFEGNGFYDKECILLSGSMTAKEKRIAKEKLADGTAAIAIGTHALIQDDVILKNPGLVITDEQHRFGVKQRQHLSDSHEHNPHVLVMSATPIPRTLALILYGDLDISIIDELPQGRLPIKNCVVGPKFRPKAYEFIEKQVREGRQALVVCPMVEESEEIDAENVIDYTKRLKDEISSDIEITYLHGKMKNKEKNEIMSRFAAGEIQVLVSTTVIEVGINVPNTTVMMVENSERFGLAQLHQLRGRVGRGRFQSYCIFMCGNEKPESLKRLDILNKSNDGFVIAEEDLKQRGPGDMFGFRQSGEQCFRIGNIYSDSMVLKMASECANVIYENNLLEKMPMLNLRMAQYSHDFEGRINL